jgi:serine O-acetyltransferase
VIINQLTKIDSDVTILRGVCIGSNRRGKNKGAPTIGSNVFIGANAAIIGNITIGNNTMIAPNSYINFDVPSNSICVGNIAKIISKESATESYIDNAIL